MEQIILKFLTRNYKITLSTYNSYMLYNKKAKSEDTLKSVMKLMVDIFCTNEEIIYNAFEKWCDNETISINNKIVEIQEKLYLQTGKTLELTPKEINEYLLKENNFYK